MGLLDILSKLRDGQLLARSGKNLVGVDPPSSGPSLASTTPAAISGAGSVGTASTAARADHVHPSTGLPSLSAANTWTDRQTLGKPSSTPGLTVASAATRHISGMVSSTPGVAHDLEVDNGSGVVVFGDVFAAGLGVADDSNCVVGMRPGNSRGRYSASLRVRSDISDARLGVEVLLANTGSSRTEPVIVPFDGGGDATNISVVLKPLGDGYLMLVRPVLPVGTVAQITGGTGVWANPTPGQQGFCSNASGGAKPCWYSGSGWVLADGSALA